MALSKAIVRLPRYFIGAQPIYTDMDVGDRVKARVFDPLKWEPGTITGIVRDQGLYGPTVTGVAIVKFDRLGEFSWRIERLDYEHSEEELVEQVLGDYFA